MPMQSLLIVGRGGWTPAFLDAAEALGAHTEVIEHLQDIDGALAADPSCVLLDLDTDLAGPELGARLWPRLGSEARPFLVAGIELDPPELRAMFEAGARDYVPMPAHKRELILRIGAALRGRFRVACLGGGTGLYTLLTGLKEVPRTLLTSIVSMSDDGGSSGRLRTTFGVLPPGDVRRSLVALSNAPELMNHVMRYRFERGAELSGHSVGNLILTALSELTGSMPRAVKALGDILNVHGIVTCVTETPTTLCAEFADGRVIKGESAIDRGLDRPGDLRIRRVWQEPEAHCSSDVYAALLAADLITIGPGDLYTSVIAGLAINGIGEALRASRGKKLYVCNLMTKPGETGGHDVADHVAAINHAVGADVLDFILVSSTRLREDAIREYAAKGQHPVVLPAPEKLRAITRAEILARDVGDRSELVRHDSSKLRHEIELLLEKVLV
ncbi:MAG: uridine diphosphate-N-acetylglucosamine-binding protein YvcK [Deltaproteobacteria bacterium]|nr:uridine diphosphate-N-acetylglucosamine-binding protein YvcK [Deltaproteobacteria bacterium]